MRRIAHETIPLNATKMVAARTMYDPQAIWGTKRRTSTRKANRQARNAKMLTMKRNRRYLTECEGEWK
jgi:hypothetical protein